MTDYDKMLDALPEAWFRWYLVALGLGGMSWPLPLSEQVKSYDKMWPPSQESLWKMLSLEKRCVLVRTETGEWHSAVGDGSSIPWNVSSFVADTGDAALLLAVMFQLGYRWTGSAWEKGASDEHNGS